MRLGRWGKLLVIFLVLLVLLAMGRLFFPVAMPHVQLPAEEVAHPGFPLTNSLLASWLSLLVLAGLAYGATRKMKLVPRGLQNLVEMALEMLRDFVHGAAGEKNGRRFFPVVATLFLFVITNSWLSLLPGFNTIGFRGEEGKLVPLFRGANTDINLPLALALMSAVFVEYWGISSVGLRSYLGKFIRVGQLLRGKVLTGLMDLFVGFIEAISELVRIISFTFRLFGNMTAGELLLFMIVFLIPWVAAVPFYGLEILIGFVQALIFGGLTLAFAIIAVTPHGEHEEKG